MTYRYSTTAQKTFNDLAQHFSQELPIHIQKKIFSFLEIDKEIYQWKYIFSSQVLPFLNKGYKLVARLGSISRSQTLVGCPHCYKLATQVNTTFFQCFTHRKAIQFEWIWQSTSDFLFIQKNISSLAIPEKKLIIQFCINNFYSELIMAIKSYPDKQFLALYLQKCIN